MKGSQVRRREFQRKSEISEQRQPKEDERLLVQKVTFPSFSFYMWVDICNVNCQKSREHFY